MNEDYEAELRVIVKARNSTRPTGGALFLCACSATLLLVFGRGLYVESFSILLLIVLLGLPGCLQVVSKRRYAAKIPCPRCHEPYGWSSNWPPNLEAYKCKNCGLKLQSEKE